MALAAGASAQSGNTLTITFPGPATGTCNSTQFWVDITNLNLYFCPGTWTQANGGGGGGGSPAGPTHAIQGNAGGGNFEGIGPCLTNQFVQGSTGAKAICAQPSSSQLSDAANLITNSTAAGGDLNGTYPNPGVAQVNGAVVPASAGVAGTNSSRQIVTATAHGAALPLTCADSSGSGTAQSCATSPSFTPASGDAILYSTTTTNTGDVTVNVNSLGAKHIRKWSAAAVLASGDLVANTPVQLIYDGTYWEISTIGNAPSGGGAIFVLVRGLANASGSISGTPVTDYISPGGALLTASSVSGSIQYSPFAGTAAAMYVHESALQSTSGAITTINFLDCGSSNSCTSPTTLLSCQLTNAAQSLDCSATGSSSITLGDYLTVQWVQSGAASTTAIVNVSIKITGAS